MNYTELTLEINPSELFSEMLTYQLGEAGFEMFEETGNGLKAYIQTENFNKKEVEEIIENIKLLNCKINYSLQNIPW